ncbi:unnamed protein product [Dicrocoelium dendriticum]|nr:unnamed protein product [Dicrocoelium dendriticum]
MLRYERFCCTAVRLGPFAKMMFSGYQPSITTACEALLVFDDSTTSVMRKSVGESSDLTNSADRLIASSHCGGFAGLTMCFAWLPSSYHDEPHLRAQAWFGSDEKEGNVKLGSNVLKAQILKLPVIRPS